MTKLEDQDTSARRQKRESPDPAAHERPGSPPLIDADYSQLNQLWIGMYPDSEIGRTGLDHETYRKCIFERVILFDLQPPLQSHSTSPLKEQLLSPKAAPLDPLVSDLSNRILSASSSVVPQTMSSIPSQSDLSTQPSYSTPFTAYSSPAGVTSPPLKSGQTPVESVHPALSISFPAVDQPKRSPSKRMAFCVDELVHVGQLWDVYRGDLIGCDGISKPQHLILKLMRPNAFPDEYPSDPDDPRSEEEGYHIKETAIAAAFREDWIYRTRLVQLQGTIVPEYHGLFTWYDPLEDKPEWPYVFAMIMEDAGDADKGCRGGSYYWEWEDILRIDRMYRTLHETAGLVQNAVADQHIIRSKDNQRLSLVDFQDARIFQESRPERQQHLLDTEDGEFLYMVHAFRNAQGELTKNI